MKINLFISRPTDCFSWNLLRTFFTRSTMTTENSEEMFCLVFPKKSDMVGELEKFQCKHRKIATRRAAVGQLFSNIWNPSNPPSAGSNFAVKRLHAHFEKVAILQKNLPVTFLVAIILWCRYTFFDNSHRSAFL